LTKAGENAIRLLGDLKAWAVEVDAAKIGSSLPLAAFRKRAYAFAIDLAIAVAVFALYLALSYAFSLVTRGPTSILDPSVIIFSLVLFWIYFTLLEGFAGQSLGKRIIGLIVVRVDGKKLFYDVAAVRNFGKVFLLPFDLIAGYRLKDSRFIRYFDKFAGTTVKDLRP
jgi:uncharacterized RDD family membrane protein YckC